MSAFKIPYLLTWGYICVFIAYIKQQPHNFSFAVEGSLVQGRPRFGGSVDVDPCFE